MKLYKALGSFFLSITVLSIYGEVNFHQGDFQSLLSTARKAGKPILIDAYTVWCGPCKMLDKEVFKDDLSSEYINKNFVSYKLDMEKGEGPLVAMKFRVNAYPSTLFLSPEGELLTKNVGFPGKEGYIEWCKDVANGKYKPYKNLKASKLKMNFPEFYQKSFTSDKWKRQRPKLEDINNYLDGQKDLFSEVNWSVISVLSYYPHNKLNWVVTNLDKLKKVYPEEEVMDVLGRIVRTKADSLAKLNLADGDQKLRLIMKNYNITDEEAVNNNLMNYYFSAKQWSKLLDFVQTKAKNGHADPGTMNSICWSIYEKSDDKEVLKKAVAAMEKAVKDKDHPYYIDTLAHLYFKTGQKAKALETARAALEKAKGMDVNMKETEKLIEKIQ